AEDSGDVTLTRAERCQAALPLGERHRRYRPEIRLTGTLKVAFVVELLDRFLGRVAVGKVVGELQLADAGLHDGGLLFRESSGSESPSENQKDEFGFNVWFGVDCFHFT